MNESVWSIRLPQGIHVPAQKGHLLKLSILQEGFVLFPPSSHLPRGIQTVPPLTDCQSPVIRLENYSKKEVMLQKVWILALTKEAGIDTSSAQKTTSDDYPCAYPT